MNITRLPITLPLLRLLSLFFEETQILSREYSLYSLLLGKVKSILKETIYLFEGNIHGGIKVNLICTSKEISWFPSTSKYVLTK